MPVVAHAGSRAVAAGSVAVGSGSWGVVPTTAASGPYVPGALTLPSFSLSLLTAPAPQFLYAANTGTLPFTASSWTVTASLGVATLSACSTSWVTSGAGIGTCPGGTITTVAVSGNGATAAPVAPAVGGHVQLEVSMAAGLSALATVSVSATVSSAQVRAGQSTHS